VEVRLLGGSHHSKRYTLYDYQTSIQLPKRIKQKKWSPGDILNFDTVLNIETETYNIMKMRRVYPLVTGKSLVKIKIAYIKVGSNIKPDTFWKLAFNHETYEYDTWQNVKTG
jgi:beta-lactamase class D